MAKTQKLKYLIDIGHPAHVHYYKNFAKMVTNKGSQVLFTCRDKEVTISLLEHYGFQYINFGRNYKSKSGKIFGLFVFTMKLLWVSLKFRPDMYLNASIYSAFIAWLSRKPHISLEDTFNMEQVNLYLPFTSCVLTGDYEHPSLGRKEVKYSGYQELLYLHPNNFKLDQSIFEELGVEYDTSYVIIRFVSWTASHDYGHKGISESNKLIMVQKLSKYSRVFITSEKSLSADLEPYRINIQPHRMHHALAYASLVIGESFTMLAEAAVLGVPAILMHDTTSYYLQELNKKYGLAFIFTESEEDQKLAVEKAIEILEKKNEENVWQVQRQKMLADKIDVSAFLVWFVENYPKSPQIVKSDSNFINKFKK